MNTKKIEEIKFHTKNVQQSIIALNNQLLDLLVQEGKSFEVTFKGKRFLFETPFDKEESHKLQKEKQKLSRLLISDCLKYVMRKLPHEASDSIWDCFMAFAAGEDISYYQLEKIEHEAYESDDVDVISSRPLNVETYELQMQDQRKGLFKPLEEELR